ncbi:JAB domain-containing protein [Bacillus swezeyi]|nr:JAB domain-containing protein [Bacillus swezeyi]
MSSLFNWSVKEFVKIFRDKTEPLQQSLNIITENKYPELVRKLANDGIRRLVKMGENEYLDMGFDKQSAERILAACSMIVYFLNSSEEPQTISSMQDATNFFLYLQLEDQRHCDVAFLNHKNMVIAKKTMLIGDSSKILLSEREILSEALKIRANSVVCAFNHTSGDPTPTVEEIQFAKSLYKAGQVVGVELLDQIIIGHSSKYTSFNEQGLIGGNKGEKGC